MKGEEKFDSTTKSTLTRALAQKMGRKEKQDWMQPQSNMVLVQRARRNDKHQKRRRRHAATRHDVLGTMTMQGHARFKTE